MQKKSQNTALQDVENMKQRYISSRMNHINNNDKETEVNNHTLNCLIEDYPPLPGNINQKEIFFKDRPSSNSNMNFTPFLCRSHQSINKIC